MAADRTQMQDTRIVLQQLISARESALVHTKRKALQREIDALHFALMCIDGFEKMALSELQRLLDEIARGARK